MTDPGRAPKFALCIRNDECADLETRKIHQILQDDDAAKDEYIRVVDESGEDYLYPTSYSVLVDLPQEARDALVAVT